MLRLKYPLTAFRCASRATRDAIVIGAAAIPLLVLAVHYDIFDLLFWYTRSHEAWELDELLSAGFVVGLASAIYAVRRQGDLKREVRLRRAAEDTAVKFALHDALTGLPNRYKFERQFAICTREEGRGERAMMVINIEDFRQVNEGYGHMVGDNLLLAVADRLAAVLESEGLLARIGAGEFVILSGALKDEEDVTGLAHRLMVMMEDPFRVMGREISITVSIGIARYPHDGSTASLLLRRAGVAKRQASDAGRSRYVMFEDGMELAQSRQMSVESKLRGAIAQDRIVPYFQPIVDLRSGNTVAFECLARWHDPQLGWVSPAQFIPVAEECEQISALSDALLRSACRHALDWPHDIRMSFNISGAQLRERTLGLDILSVLGELGFSPARLELEITETALVRDVPLARETLDILARTGMTIALDDFGTGHSSLRYICDFPIHKLKIDQSFVRSMCRRRDSEQIVSAVIGLAHGLGIVATAEGIEEEAQKTSLTNLGCDFGQGYLFGKPMLAEEVHDYLRLEGRQPIARQSRALGEKKRIAS